MKTLNEWDNKTHLIAWLFIANVCFWAGVFIEKSKAEPTTLFAVATTNATDTEKERQYWQDELIQLSHAWRTRFAHQDPNNVQLAYQSFKVITAIQAQAGAIGVLRQQVVDLAKGNIILQGEVAELTFQLKAHTDQPTTIDGGEVQDEADPNE